VAVDCGSLSKELAPSQGGQEFQRPHHRSHQRGSGGGNERKAFPAGFVVPSARLRDNRSAVA